MPDPVFHEPPPDIPLAEIGRYRRLNDARERGLVAAAMELPHWVVRQGREYVLIVEERHRQPVAEAVRDFEREESARPRPAPVEPLRIPGGAVLLALAVLGALYAMQGALPSGIVERGVADNMRIRAGEWWRVVTALTLHGDVEHIASNLGLALFVFAFAFARLGTGCGLLAIVLGGALGNALNALLHIGRLHRSIGSSTALFAGLGLLAGAELAARLTHHGARSWSALLVPVGAGMAFLAMFGGGSMPQEGHAPGNVDLGAHLFGLLAGMLLGVAFIFAGWKNDAPRRMRIAAGLCAVALPAVCWAMAVR